MFEQKKVDLSKSPPQNQGLSFMSLMKGGCLFFTFVILMAFLSLVFFGLYGVSVVNNEISLRKQVEAQQKANEAVFDTVWKTISQQANVKDDYKEDFRKVWEDILKAQNSGDSSFKVFINRVNPNFDSEIYKKLMNTIEAQRKDFLNNQKKLLDINREHEFTINKFPNKFILQMFGNAQPIEVKIVTSEKTEEAFKTQKEDNIKLR